jgi:hypothetical protein
MNNHKNARLTLKGREFLIARLKRGEYPFNLPRGLVFRYHRALIREAAYEEQSGACWSEPFAKRLVWQILTERSLGTDGG